MESLSALRERLDDAAPARTLVLTPRAGQARWLARLLLDHGPLVGGHFTGLDGLVDGCARATFGPPARTVELLEAVRAALEVDATFERIHEVRRYQRMVLDLFVELERASGDGVPRGIAATARDEALLEAFARFRGGLRRATRGRWWAGDAPRRVADALSGIPLLRDRAGAIAMGWRSERPWETALMDALDAERWPVPFATAPEDAPRERLACASAEVELAAVSRRLRRAARGAGPVAVVVPADEVPWWITRLGHRDVPVRAWLARPAAATAAARTFDALVRVITAGERVGRRELAALLMGPALRPWPVIAEQLTRWHALPADGLSVGTVQAAWRRLRRGSGTLAQWEERLEAARERTTEELIERGRRRELPEGETAAAVERWEIAHRALAAAVRALEALEDAGDARRLLSRWGFGRGTASSLDPEHVAARTVLETLNRLSELPLKRAAPAVSAALEGAVRGTWIDEGPDPVWVMSYGEVPPLLLDRVVMAGLERVPSPPRRGPLLSDAAREALGFATSFQSFEEAIELLESLADAPDVLACWRTRDASGAACPPGPWIAARPGPAPVQVGLDALTPSEGAAPTSPLERDVLRPGPALARRVEAVASHERPEVGPHTGALGIAPPASAPYTISALQTYGQNPYACFLTRLLGLEAATVEAGDALDALEQGTLVHAALEAGVRGGLDGGPLDVRADGRALWDRTHGALGDAFREAGEGVLALPVWRGELVRWSRELGAWWNNWAARLAAPVEADPHASDDASRERRARYSSQKYQRARAWRDLRSTEDPARWRAIVDSGVFGRSWYRTKGADPLLEGPLDPALEAELNKLDQRAEREIAAEEGAVDALVDAIAQAQAVAPGGRILAVELGLGEGGCVIELGDGERPRPVRLVGRVDRLEWDHGRDRLVICDYKSGEPPRASLKSAIASGEHLQLPLYALAVERLGADGALPGVPADAVPAVGMLRLEYLRRRKGEAHVAVAVAPGEPVGFDERGQELDAVGAAARFAGAFVDGMEAGWYPCVDRGTPSDARLAQAMRHVPGADGRDPALPAPLEPLE